MRKFRGLVCFGLIILLGSIFFWPSRAEIQEIPSTVVAPIVTYATEDGYCGYLHGVFLKWDAVPGVDRYKIIVDSKVGSEHYEIETNGSDGFIYGDLAEKISPPWWNIFNCQGAGSWGGTLADAQAEAQRVQAEDLEYASGYTFKVYPDSLGTSSLNFYYPDDLNTPVTKVNPNYSIYAWVTNGFVTIDYNRRYVDLVVEISDKNGAPLSSDFTLTMSLASDGGHQHRYQPVQRPLGRLGNTDIFISFNQTSYVYNGKTESDGFCQLTYYYPQVAGDILFELKPEKASYCSKIFHIGVDNLRMINFDEGSVWFVGDNQNHPANHYANLQVGDYLQDVISRFRTKYNWDDVIYINDISLEKGGVFDVGCDNPEKNWVPPHKYHRAGCEIDFGTCPPYNGTGGEGFGIPLPRCSLFDCLLSMGWEEGQANYGTMTMIKRFLSECRKTFPNAKIESTELEHHLHIYFGGDPRFGEDEALMSKWRKN